MKAKQNSPELEPIIVKEGSVSATIYPTVNRIYRTNPLTGERELKSQHSQFTLVYYSGSSRVKRKFADLAKARAEAEHVVIKLANGETEALKLTGGDRADYVKAMQRLREWKPDADLNISISDYVSSVKRLPENVTLKECVDAYLKRHPTGLPHKLVREVVDELINSKTAAGKSEIYIGDLEGRLIQFSETFQVPISAITGRQIEEYIRGLGKSGRTQNNHRRIIGTLFKFAIKRGYLPKDHDEMNAVEKADDQSGDIEIFTPDELQKLFANARAEIIPYLSIAAFAGLRSAEIERLDWSEINLTKRFIEIKASKAKTASRRLVPITDNLAAWLTPHAQPFGPVTSFANMSKQLTMYLAPKAKLEWKHTGLRHTFIAYRLADIKDIGQVSLEAGNSPQMIFKHYRQLVTEEHAKEWFGVMPPKQAENVVPLKIAVNG